MNDGAILGAGGGVGVGGGQGWANNLHLALVGRKFRG